MLWCVDMDVGLNRKARWKYRSKGKILNIIEIKESLSKKERGIFDFLRFSVMMGKVSFNFSYLGKLDEFFF